MPRTRLGCGWFEVLHCGDARMLVLVFGTVVRVLELVIVNLSVLSRVCEWSRGCDFAFTP
eukprot:gene6271-7447_t